MSEVLPEIIHEVIKNCGFETHKNDSVIIKQGDNGDKMYIVVGGSVSIYVLQDKENNSETRSFVEQAIERAKHASLSLKMDRSHLGTMVWSCGEGGAVGEIALLRDDCIRTASVVTNGNTSFIVINRQLYNMSVRDVLEEDFNVKTNFVESHWLFSKWAPKYRKQMAISLQRKTLHFGYFLARQGDPADAAYFILSGEVQVSANVRSHKYQFKDLWKEMENKFPFVLPLKPGRNYIMTTFPHVELQKRKTSVGEQSICLVRGFEYIGFLPFIFELATYPLNALCTSEAQVLVINKQQYEWFIEKRHADMITKFKLEIATRLNIYVIRLKEAPLLEYLLLKLLDSSLLQIYTTAENKVWVGNCLLQEIKNMRNRKEQVGDKNLARMLQTRYNSKLNDASTSTPECFLDKVEGRISSWLKGASFLISSNDISNNSQD